MIEIGPNLKELIGMVAAMLCIGGIFVTTVWAMSR